MNLQQLAPVFAVLSVALTLIFQGFNWFKQKDIKLTALAFTCGFGLIPLGFVAAFQIIGVQCIPILITLFIAGMFCVLYFILIYALKKEFRKK